MKVPWLLILIPIMVQSLPYHYKDRNTKRENRKVNPSFNIPNTSGSEARMMGLNTGNEAADFEAGMWLMALIGTLAAAVPVAFLNPSLGFKKRSFNEDPLMGQVANAIEKFKDL